MALRIKRQGMALLSYLMFLPPLIYAVANHWMHFGMVGVWGFSGLIVLINTAFFLLIRSGYSKRFSDPSLTFSQIAVALMVALSLVCLADQARPAFQTLFFASFFFGVFGLNRRQFWRLAVATIVGYALVVGSQLWRHPPSMDQKHLEVMQFFVLSMLLCWLAAIGSHVARLRQHLSLQKNNLVAALDRLRLLVSYDELTGVFNRRHLMQMLEHERASAARNAYPFTVCLLDIDHFKQINDRHGHATGDEVLREFSARMRQNTRKMDWLGRNGQTAGQAGAGEVAVGRYGGEEFMIVMPHTGLAAAALGVERLRTAILATPFHTPTGPLEVRFSAGIAEFVAGESVDATIARADKALYRAKAEGRNQTHLASAHQ